MLAHLTIKEIGILNSSCLDAVASFNLILERVVGGKEMEGGSPSFIEVVERRR